MRKCLYCGINFEPANGKQKYCCKEHRWKCNRKGNAAKAEENRRERAEREKKVFELRVSGFSYKEIIDSVGYYTNEATVKNVCTKTGANAILEEKTKGTRDAKIIQLRKNNMSMNDIIKETGLSYQIVSKVCNENNLGGPLVKKTIKGKGNQFSKRTEEERKAYVESFLNDRFSYVSGYKHCDSKIIIKCNNCHQNFEHSMVSIRKGKNTICPFCIAKERELRESQKEKEKELLAMERDKQRRERAKQKKQAYIAKLRVVVCEECGKAFTTTRKNVVCCSPECSKRRSNRIMSRRKDKRISKEKRIDVGITAKRLYERDNGICWLCGELCDLDDYENINGYIICGNRYPSVDHVIPICEGGEDSWDNVKLAHRYCNSERYWKEHA